MKPNKMTKALVTATSIAAMITLSPLHASRAAEAKNVAPWVSRAQKVGAASDATTIRVVFYLGLKHKDSLPDLVKSIYTRGNPLYQKYLSPDEFHSQFGQDAKDVALVRETVRSLGFKIESVAKSGFFVEASGTVAQVKSALGVSQDLYSYKGLVLRANKEEPRLPARIANLVTHVDGLDEGGALRHPFHMAADEANEARKPAMASDLGGGPIENAPPAYQENILSPACSVDFGANEKGAAMSTAAGPYGTALPWLNCGYTPQQIQQAYSANQVTQTGATVTVGIIDAFASPTIVADANAYAKNHGLPTLTKANFKQIIPAGIYRVPASATCGPQGWYTEESLDVAAVHSMAPGAKIVFVGAADCGPSLNTALYNAIDNKVASILTNSWGNDGEADIPAAQIESDSEALMQAAATGISVLFSSGDNGDNVASLGIASGEWPATSPYATAVGGTSMQLVSAGSSDIPATKSEWGWGTYRAYLGGVRIAKIPDYIKTTGPELPLAFYAGSGGGPSLVELAPDYQSALPFTLSGFTTIAGGLQIPLETPHRLTPDIAMDADPYTGFLYGETFTITGDPVLDNPCKPVTKTTEYCEFAEGGTSLASPLFAGVLALVNQARLAKGMPVVGFVNPALYALPVSGPATLQYEPILDVVAPYSPNAVLRGYQTDLKKVRLVTMNSAVDPSTNAVIEGMDTSYLTTPGYDEVTGLGVPYIPLLIQAFTTQP